MTLKSTKHVRDHIEALVSASLSRTAPEPKVAEWLGTPKTAHHAGKSSRTIPLFPELRQPLTEVFDQAEPGTEFVITSQSDSQSDSLRSGNERN